MKSLILITSIIVIGTFGFFAIVFNYQLKPAVADSVVKNVFIIEKGNGFQQIAENLQSAGTIRSAASFKLYVLLRGWADKLKPGSYKMSPSLRANSIAKILYSGPITEASITIPEGWTLSMIENKLKDSGVLAEGESLSNFKIKDFQNKADGNYFAMFEGAPKEASLEGFLFPDTYRFYQNRSALEVAKKFLTNFQNKVSSELNSQIQKTNLGYYKIVTMASLMEAEIPHEVDRPLAAGVLWKRLNSSMPLQIDATIVYIKCEIKHLADCRKLNKSDFKIKSSYNTYLNNGLPFGPIGNPGLSALKAVLYPETSDYWYYLSDLETGQTVFSRTLEEHNAAKAEYLK
ncbi:MAG: endolytic transglycosylase MltG [bacterium]|nr:endolytic transglycosylase MltG [bacterium]